MGGAAGLDEPRRAGRARRGAAQRARTSPRRTRYARPLCARREAAAGAPPAGRVRAQVGAAARTEGDAGAGGELAQLVEALATDGDAAGVAAARFSKGDKARSNRFWGPTLP